MKNIKLTTQPKGNSNELKTNFETWEEAKAYLANAITYTRDERNANRLGKIGDIWLGDYGEYEINYQGRVTDISQKYRRGNHIDVCIDENHPLYHRYNTSYYYNGDGGITIPDVVYCDSGCRFKAVTVLTYEYLEVVGGYWESTFSISPDRDGRTYWEDKTETKVGYFTIGGECIEFLDGELIHPDDTRRKLNRQNEISEETAFVTRKTNELQDRYDRHMGWFYKFLIVLILVTVPTLRYLKGYHFNKLYPTAAIFCIIGAAGHFAAGSRIKNNAEDTIDRAVKNFRNTKRLSN